MQADLDSIIFGQVVKKTEGKVRGSHVLFNFRIGVKRNFDFGSTRL